jgi:hypothetical protein
MDVGKGIVYYSDNELDSRIMELAQDQLSRSGLPIVSVSLKPLDFGENHVLELERGPLTLFKQILTGLKASKSDVIFFAEHDVLYHPSHFDFIPPDKNKVYYNTNTWNVFYNAKTWSRFRNIWKWDAEGRKCLHYDSIRTSQLCAYRDLLIEHYEKRVALVEKKGFSYYIGYEPGSRHKRFAVDSLQKGTWVSEHPNIDIKHGRNLTIIRWKKEQFRCQKYTSGWKESTIDKIDGWDLSSLLYGNGAKRHNSEQK